MPGSLLDTVACVHKHANPTCEALTDPETVRGGRKWESKGNDRAAERLEGYVEMQSALEWAYSFLQQLLQWIDSWAISSFPIDNNTEAGRKNKRREKRWGYLEYFLILVLI